MSHIRKELHILVVDDDGEKTRIIASHIAELGVAAANIHTAGTAHDAQQRASTTAYDLALVDLVLPNMPGGTPEPDAGINLIRIFSRMKTGRPKWMAAITAYEQDAEMDRRLGGLGSVLLRYSETDSTWREGIASLISNVVASQAPSNGFDMDFGSLAVVVCALATPEAHAVKALKWGWRQAAAGRLAGDHCGYMEGEFPKGPTSHDFTRVICASAPRMGIAATTAVALRLVTAYRPRLLVMTGITAGIRDQCEIGDILCADPVFEWGTGKWTTESGEARFEPAIHPFPLDPAIRSIFDQSEFFNGELQAFYKACEGGRPRTAPQVRRGVVASGPSVVASGDIRDFVKEHHRKLIGIDMEAYGIFQAADEAPKPRPRAVVVKSVVDFADERKGDSHQEYAAAASAFSLETVLSRFVVSPNLW